MYLDPARDRPHPDQLCLDAAGAFELPVFAEGARLYLEDWLFNAEGVDSAAICGLLDWGRAHRNEGPESIDAAERGYRLYDLERGFDATRLVRFITELAGC